MLNQQIEAGDLFHICLPSSKPGERVKMTFCHIPSGEFRMGHHRSNHSVEPGTVESVQSFWMGQTPVTQQQFNCWKVTLPKEKQPDSSGPKDHPADFMNWFQAMEFCKWMTESCKDQMPERFELASLPTEAHWEYACRAGSNTEYWNGDGEKALDEVGWSGVVPRRSVAKKKCNPWGLYDVHGNVWEWCWDGWNELIPKRHKIKQTKKEKKLIELPPEITAYRIMKGGSCEEPASKCRSASRIESIAENSGSDGGFRVCLISALSSAQGKILHLNE